MGKGVLEVHLVDARGLSGSDFLGKIDPYVIVQYRSQERKSSVARGEEPVLERGVQVPDQLLCVQRAAQAHPPDHGPRQLLQRRLHRRGDDRRDGHHQPGRGARLVPHERGEAQRGPRRQHLPRRDQGRHHLHRRPGRGR